MAQCLKVDVILDIEILQTLFASKRFKQPDEAILDPMALRG